MRLTDMKESEGALCWLQHYPVRLVLWKSRRVAESFTCSSWISHCESLMWF